MNGKFTLTIHMHPRVMQTPAQIERALARLIDSRRLAREGADRDLKDDCGYIFDETNNRIGEWTVTIEPTEEEKRKADRKNVKTIDFSASFREPYPGGLTQDQKVRRNLEDVDRGRDLRRPDPDEEDDDADQV